MSALTTQQQNQSPLAAFLGKLASTEQVQAVVSRHITTEKVVALITSEAARSPQLAEAAKTSIGRKSLVSFFMLATQLGLEPGAARGLLYPTPRRVHGKWTVLPVIGYKGYCELARRSKQIVRLNANVFYGEEIERGLVNVSYEPPMVEHAWHPDVEKRDEDIVGAYAIAKLTTTDEPVIIVLNRADIEKSRRLGAANGPWKSHYAAMARKTAIRRLLTGGLVPLGAELNTAVSEDIVAEDRPLAHVHVDLDIIEEEAMPAPAIEVSSAAVIEGPAVEEDPEPVAKVTTSTGEVIDIVAEDIEDKPEPEAKPEPKPEPKPGTMGSRMAGALPEVPTLNELPPAPKLAAPSDPSETPPAPAVVLDSTKRLSREDMVGLKRENTAMEERMGEEQVGAIRATIGWSKSMRSKKTIEYHTALTAAAGPAKTKDEEPPRRRAPTVGSYSAGDWLVSPDGDGAIQVMQYASTGVKFRPAGQDAPVQSNTNGTHLAEQSAGWIHMPPVNGGYLPHPRALREVGEDTVRDMVNTLSNREAGSEVEKLQAALKSTFQRAARIEARLDQRSVISELGNDQKRELLFTSVRLAMSPSAWSQA